MVVCSYIVMYGAWLLERVASGGNRIEVLLLWWCIVI